MSLFSSILGLIGGSSKKKAAVDAANHQQDAATAALNATNTQFANTTANLQPTIDRGNQAGSAQADLLGLNGGDPQSAAITSLQQSPLFQSLYRQGTQAIDANSAATGGLRGGNEQNSLANFGSDTLASVIQQQLANLGGVSSQGSQTGLGLGQLGQNNSALTSQLGLDVGTAQANRSLAKGSGTANMLGDVSGLLTGSTGSNGVASGLDSSLTSSLTSLIGGLGTLLGGQNQSAPSAQSYLSPISLVSAPGVGAGSPGLGTFGKIF